MPLNEPEIMESHQSAGFWFRWVFANAAGFLVGRVSAMLILGAVDRLLNPGIYEDIERGALILRLMTDEEMLLNSIITGLAVGFFMGAGQWLVLRGWLPRPRQWIWVSCLGWALGAGLGLGLMPFPADSGVGGLVLGGIIGGLEWLVLRRYFRYSGWWILIWAGLGLGVKFVSGMQLGMLDEAAALITGAVIGGLSGLFMIFLLEQPAGREKNGENF